MAYYEIKDFKAGLDTRKIVASAAPGSLARADDCNVDRGGEIEKRLAWVPSVNLPDGTFGLTQLLTDGDLIVFGSGPEPAGMPVGTAYQQLAHNAGHNMTAVLAVDTFDDRAFVIAQYSNGDVLYFYDGAETNPHDTPIGRCARTYGQKVYVGVGPILRFSGLNEPTEWLEDLEADPQVGVGSGFINLGNQANGTREILALSEYADQMAIFTRQDVQIWSISVDPSANVRLQTLTNTGALSTDSVVPYGDIDVFFLAPSGIRSLKARDSTDAAFASDIGSAIDSLIIKKTRADLAVARRAKATMEPLNGRYMLAIGREVYVFNYFPGSKISAWTRYFLPGEPEAWLATPERLFTRVGNTVYEYGGADQATYDDTAVVLETPFLDAERPANMKELTKINAACEGLWRVEVALDPNTPDDFQLIGEVENSTFNTPAIPVDGESTAFRFRFTSLNDGPAVFSRFTFHFNDLGDP